MNAIIGNFKSQMSEIEKSIDLIHTMQLLVKPTVSIPIPRNGFTRNAITVRDAILALQSTVAIYDGLYLSACAQYELAVRDLIERYVQLATTKLQPYYKLPEPMRKWHPEGCAHILLNLNADKFEHLDQDVVTASIASCVTSSKKKPYRLMLEAFSDNERNFRADMLEDCLGKRLGLPKCWDKLSRQTVFQNYIKTSNDEIVKEVAKKRLNAFIQRRNDIMHRGKSYYTPSESEVRDCVEYFAVLIEALGEVLSLQLASL